MIKIEDSFIEKIEAKIVEGMEKYKINGLSIGMVDETGLIWGKGYGHTNHKKERPVDLETNFSIGSCSKTYTALAFLIGEEKGYFNLNDKLIDHYPEFSIKTRFDKEDYKNITLKHLLSHRAGLQHFQFQTDGISTKGYSFEECVANLTDTWQKYLVNTRFSYSNIGLDLIAFLLQKKSGKKYPDFFQDEIAKPLSMKSSYVGGTSPFPYPNTATGYYQTEEAKPWIVDWPNYGSGAIHSSIMDMTKFLQLQFNKGKNAEGIQLVSPKRLAKMFEFPEYAKARKSGYGLGIGLNQMKFKDILCCTHLGDTDGCLTLHKYIPYTKIGMLVCVNEGVGTPKFMVELADLGLNEMLRQRLGHIPEPDTFTLTFKDHERQDVSIEELKNLEGIYIDRFNHAHVHVVNKKLVLPFRTFVTPEKTYELNPINATNFTHPELSLIRFQLSKGKPLYVSIINSEGSENILDFEEEKASLTKEQLSYISPYLGDYVSDRSDCTRIYAKLSEKDGGLYVNTVWGMDAKLYQYKENIFYTSEGLVVEFHEGQINCDNYRLYKWDLSFDKINLLYEQEPSHIMFNPSSQDYLLYFLEHIENLELKGKVEELFGDKEDKK